MPNRTRNRIDRVTTRSGDRGETSLADGRRYAKHDAKIELVGDFDEANSFLGLLAAEADASHRESLARIQSRLFDAGAWVASGASSVDWLAVATELEAETAALNARLPPLREFILPAGGRRAATAHVARAVVRRAERAWWRAAADIDELKTCQLGVVLNRLSDYLFVLARTLAEGEQQWQGPERKAP